MYFHYVPFICSFINSSVIFKFILLFSTVVWGFDMKAAAVLRQMSSTQLLSDELTSSPTNSNSDSRKEPTEEVRYDTNSVYWFVCNIYMRTIIINSYLFVFFIGTCYL